MNDFPSSVDPELAERRRLRELKRAQRRRQVFIRRMIALSILGVIALAIAGGIALSSGGSPADTATIDPKATKAQSPSRSRR